jgi:hypothetical protein
MSDWLLSSDDESAELAAMHEKLRAMKEDDDASRKRKPPSLEDSASDATSDGTHSGDEGTHIRKRTKEEDPLDSQETPTATNVAKVAPSRRRQVEQASSPSLVRASFSNEDESCESCESPLPIHTTKNSRQAAAATSSKSADDEDTAWHNFFDGDDAALDAVLLSLEMESPVHASFLVTKQQDKKGARPGVVDDSATKSVTTSEIFSATAKPSAPPQARSTIPQGATKRRRTTTTTTTTTNPGESEQVHQDEGYSEEGVTSEEKNDDKEEDWVEEFLRQELHKVSETMQAVTAPPEPYEPTPEDGWEDSFEPLGAEEPSLDGEASIVADETEEGDGWINELLRKEEQKAQGPYEESTPAFPSPLTQGTGAVDEETQSLRCKNVDEAFGFTPSQSTHHESTANTSQPILEHVEEEDLEVPRCPEADQGLDNIDRDERHAEVDPSRYLSPPYRERPPPLVHHYTANSHPPTSRRRLPVLEVFSQPQVASLFLSKFENFNPMQSELANSLAHSNDHMVVAAPTGAGKTAIFEMAMARFFNVDLQTLAGNERPSARGHYASQSLSSHRKIVYIAPSKALCEERFEDWSKRMAKTRLGIDVATVTGDGDPGEAFRDIASAQLILTTPEKWDSVTRRWTENFFLLASVKLVLVDEFHLVADTSRGPCLEAILCRLKSIQRAAQDHVVSQQDISASTSR